MQEKEDSIDRVIKIVSDDLNKLSLPEHEWESLAFNELIETLKMTKFILTLYKDR